MFKSQESAAARGRGAVRCAKRGLTAVLVMLPIIGFPAVAQQTAAPAPADAAPAAQAPIDTISLDKPAPKPLEREKEPVKLGTVTVTGSHIKRADTATAQPVTTISKKDLDITGITNIGDILQTLPSAGSALNTTINNGGTGAIEIDLRNLGSNRVLVLVDGHRWVNGLRSLSTSSVDLNTIPLAMIDHVDILQDGASAAYGSDAITGVVNIVTRKSIKGISFSTQTGVYTQGDGAQQLHTLSGGHSFGNFLGGQTSIIGAFSFQQERAVFAGDRDISKLPLINTGLTRGSSFLPEGRFLFVPNQQNSTQINAATNNTGCPNIAGGVGQGVINGYYPPEGMTVDAGMGVPPISTPGTPTPPGGYPPITVPGQTTQIPAGLNLCDLTHITGAGYSAISNYRTYNSPQDNFNYTLTNYLATPFKTYNSFIALNHDFGENVTFSFVGLSSVRSSQQQLAPQPISIGNAGPVIGGFIPSTLGTANPVSYNQATYISRDSPYNPFGGTTGQDIGRYDPNDPTNTTVPCPPGGDPTGQLGCGMPASGGLVGLGAVLRRFVEVGNRIQSQEVPTTYARGGFSGNIDLILPIQWDLGYSFGQSRQTDRLQNLLNMQKLMMAAIGDAANCPAPCVPINLLGGPGTITRQMLDYIEFDDYSSTSQKQYDQFANISTAIPRVLPGGDLGIAFGVERRTNHYTNTPSLESINNTTSGGTALPTDGAVSSKEAYLEFVLPLVSHLPFVDKLELNLAGRFSDYGQFGSSPNGKVGLLYKPYPDLLLRSTFSTSFRAPDVGELYLGSSGSYPPLIDPCAAANRMRPAGSNADTNCNADGYTSVTQIAAQILSPYGGNPNLKAETSHSFSLGTVFSPDQITGLDLSVDYFKIGINNFIQPPGGQYILNQCYDSAPSQRSLCSNVQRGASGALNQVYNYFQNFPKLETSGFDYAVNYVLPTKKIDFLSGAGKFKLVTAATFVSSYNQLLVGSDGTLQKNGFVGKGNFDNGTTLPRWKINPSLQWALGNVSASVSSHIVWHQIEACDDGISPSLVSLGLCSDPNHKRPDGTDGPLNKIKTTAKTDLQLGYYLKRYSTGLTLGVQNVFNTDPPISYSQGGSNSFDATQYWVPGVLPYFRLTKDF